MTGGMCFRAKIEGKCMSEHSFLLYYHIFMNKHSRNTISDRQIFLGTKANVLLRIFYYNALGAFFEALVQRTGDNKKLADFT